MVRSKIDFYTVLTLVILVALITPLKNIVYSYNRPFNKVCIAWKTEEDIYLMDCNVELIRLDRAQTIWTREGPRFLLANQDILVVGR